MKDNSDKKPLVTTLNEIRKHSPCKPSWEKLLAALGKTKADDEPLPIADILKHLNIQDAVWCLRCFDYIDYSLFLADVAESVLPVFESHSDSDAVRLCIAGIRDYAAGIIDAVGLRELRIAAAYDAADAAAYAAADARDDKWKEITILFRAHFCEIEVPE